jgi:hypothetical protein
MNKNVSLQIVPFRFDPVSTLLRLFRGHGFTTILSSGLLLSLLLLGLKVGAAGISGSLLMDFSYRVFESDFAQLPLFILPRVLLTWADGQLPFIELPLTSAAAGLHRSTSLPYVRDYADILATIFSAFNLVVVALTWKRVRTLVDELWSSEVINHRLVTKRQLGVLVKRANAQIAARLNNISIWVASAGTVILIRQIVVSNGIYPGLATPDISAETLQVILVQNSWWNSWGVSTWLHLAIWTLTTRYIVANVYLGVVLVRIMFVLARRAKRLGQPLFIPQYFHSDGYQGLNPFRSSLILSWWGIIIIGLTMATILFWVPIPQALFAAPFVLLFVLANPICGIYPIVYLHRQNRKYLDNELGIYYSKLKGSAMATGGIDLPPIPVPLAMLVRRPVSA